MAKTTKTTAKQVAEDVKVEAEKAAAETTNFFAKARETLGEQVEAMTERAKGAWESAQERAKTARENAGEALGVLRTSIEAAGAGIRDVNLKVIEFVQTDANTYFDTIKKVATAKSVKEAIEIQAAYVRSQFQTSVQNVRTVSELAAGAAKDAFKPVREGFANLRKAA